MPTPGRPTTTGLKPGVTAISGRCWPLPDEGTLYVGEKGALLHTWAGLQVFPEALGKRLDTVPRTLPRRRGTWGEWAEACRGGEPAGCNFNWAEPLTEIVLLGNIAIRTGKLLEWDVARGTFTNSPEANRQLHADYPNGWSLEAV
ncbi:MAG: hypothetical protein HS113_03830 [Verrucomicrobiales bacterium]|nr:hypothetical protein [Verrucomicrobiales bacterium]